MKGLSTTIALDHENARSTHSIRISLDGDRKLDAADNVGN